jgi:rubredoxin
MSGRCDCGALDCPACYPSPRPRTEDERPRGWWPGEGAGSAFVLPDAPPDDWVCAHCGALVSDHGSLVDEERIELANEDPDRKDSWICGMCGEEKFLPPNGQKGSDE